MSQGPGNLPLLDYVINIGVAIVGASVRFAREWQMNYTVWDRKRIAIEAFINATTAGFVGLLTFWVLTSWKIDPLYTAFAVGIMGHAGPEGLSLLKESLFNAIRSKPPKE
jgi:hypothetical protein